MSKPRGASILAALLSLATLDARAGHTAHLDVFDASAPGCLAEGVWAVPFFFGTGTLGAGTYEYAIRALDAGGELGSGACAPATVVIDPPATNATAFQWLAVPGATAYRIYRKQVGVSPALEALVVAAGPVTTVPATSTGCASGGRCLFLDRGLATEGTQTAAQVAAHPYGGTPVDLRVVARTDFGGADANTAASASGDDPFPSALKTELLQWPRGIVLDAGATRASGNGIRCPLTGADSLLGSTTAYGSDDPNEDTCPRATLLGSVQATVRTASGIQTMPGEIYNGTPKGAEPLRLYFVLRPACSSGSLFAPGSASCGAALGSTDRQLEKIFIAGVTTPVDRGAGVTALDTNLVQAEDDGALPDHLNVLAPSGGPLVRALTLDLQLRQLSIDLFAFADQGTATGADDLPFAALPQSCVRTLGVKQTTYADATVAVAAATLNATADCIFIDAFDD